jgi:hypothetical protein
VNLCDVDRTVGWVLGGRVSEGVHQSRRLTPLAGEGAWAPK